LTGGPGGGEKDIGKLVNYVGGQREKLQILMTRLGREEGQQDRRIPGGEKGQKITQNRGRGLREWHRKVHEGEKKGDMG